MTRAVSTCSSIISSTSTRRSDINHGRQECHSLFPLSCQALQHTLLLLSRITLKHRQILTPQPSEATENNGHKRPNKTVTSDVLTSCHVMSCHVMPCHVVSCHVTSRHVTSRHVMSCHVMPRSVMSCHVRSCHVMGVTFHGALCLAALRCVLASRS